MSIKEKDLRRRREIYTKLQSLDNGEYEVHTFDDCLTEIVRMSEDDFIFYHNVSAYGDEHPKWQEMQEFLKEKIQESEI